MYPGLCLALTTPKNTKETVHYHYFKRELYLLLSGICHIWVKYRWERENAWRRLTLDHAGAMAIISPQACHFVAWETEDGAMLVFQHTTNTGGVGRPPSEKTTCTNGCPYFQKGCDGFTGM
jgi:hypothetical protein